MPLFSLHRPTHDYQLPLGVHLERLSVFFFLGGLDWWEAPQLTVSLSGWVELGLRAPIRPQFAANRTTIGSAEGGLDLHHPPAPQIASTVLVLGGNRLPIHPGMTSAARHTIPRLPLEVDLWQSSGFWGGLFRQNHTY